MIHQIVKRISAELAELVHYNISLARALDLMEASTKNLEELIAINTMRESLHELESSQPVPVFAHPVSIQKESSALMMYQS